MKLVLGMLVRHASLFAQLRKSKRIMEALVAKLPRSEIFSFLSSLLIESWNCATNQWLTIPSHFIYSNVFRKHNGVVTCVTLLRLVIKLTSHLNF